MGHYRFNRNLISRLWRRLNGASLLDRGYHGVNRIAQIAIGDDANERPILDYWQLLIQCSSRIARARATESCGLTVRRLDVIHRAHVNGSFSTDSYLLCFKRGLLERLRCRTFRKSLSLWKLD